jgi:hypothetical protein
MVSKLSKIVLLQLSFILVFILSFSTTKAAHWQGSEITYQRTSSYTYTVSVVMYRECRSLSQSAPDLIVSCSSQSVILKTTRKSISDITLVCDTASSPCSPANTRASAGLEKHIYQVEVDLKTNQ